MIWNFWWASKSLIVWPDIWEFGKLKLTACFRFRTPLRMSKGKPPQFQIESGKKKTCFYMFHFQTWFFLKPIRNLKMRKKQHEITMMLTGSITITYKWSWLFNFEHFPQDPWHKRDLCCHACDKTFFWGKLLGPNEILVGEIRTSYKTWFQNP